MVLIFRISVLVNLLCVGRRKVTTTCFKYWSHG